MKNFEQIAETPEALAAFLAALPVADGPWDAEFRRVFCAACSAENCDGDNCPHNAERNNPLWWLSLEAAKGKGAIIGQLKNLCSFCREMGKRGGIWAERAWSADAETLEVAVGILSELEGMKEVRISAAPEKETELWRMIQEAGPGMIVNLPAEERQPGAWELMRDILAGRRPAPEGTVFDVVIDMTGNPQAIRQREELGYTARTLTLTMPGGDTVKLNSAAEAYGLAACIENMAVRVWPDSKPEK